jgi:Dolichyl-phosphate-mannose-protein mannosyltransferase
VVSASLPTAPLFAGIAGNASLMKTRLFILIGFLVVLAGIRLFLTATIELSPDESYYCLWAQHPDFSYYERGPGVALSIVAGTSLFGSTELGVRCLAPIFGLGTSIFVYLLARKLMREKTAFWAALVLNLLPIFHLDSIAMTPDGPSLFFWAAALYTSWLAIERANFSLFWPLTGILIGLGFLCDYWNALQLLSILFFLVVVPKHRHRLRRSGFYVALLVFLIFLAPLVVWNQQHEWITLEHLPQRGDLRMALAVKPSQLAGFLRSQFLLYSPLLLAGYILAFFVCIRRSFRNSRICFLFAFSWPVALQFLILGFRDGTQPTWTAPALIALGILAAHFWMHIAQENRIAGALCVAALAISGIMSSLITNTDLVRMVGIPFPYSADPTSRWRGWKTAAEQVEGFRKQFESRLGSRVFLIADSYRTSSALSFYLKEKRTEGPGHPPVYIPESQDIQNQFSFWPRYDEFVEAGASSQKDTTFTEEAGVNPFMDRTALYITDRPEVTPPQNLQSAFTRWELAALYKIDRKNDPLREIRVFACYQYQTLPL